MTDFTAIDFETANGQRSSVCSVGVREDCDAAIITLDFFVLLHLINLLQWTA